MYIPEFHLIIESFIEEFFVLVLYSKWLLCSYVLVHTTYYVGISFHDFDSFLKYILYTLKATREIYIIIQEPKYGLAKTQMNPEFKVKQRNLKSVYLTIFIQMYSDIRHLCKKRPARGGGKPELVNKVREGSNLLPVRLRVSTVRGRC